MIGALAVLLFPRPAGLRDVLHIGAAALQCWAAILLVRFQAGGDTARVVFATPAPGVDLALSLEPLAAIAGALIASLNFLHAIHAAGMARAAGGDFPERTLAYVALASASAMAAAFSSNLFTLYVALQALTLSTFPLLTRGREQSVVRAGGYLSIMLVASAGLFLPAMVWTHALSGSLEFRVGGLLAGRADDFALGALLTMFVLGVAQAATPPMQGWLESASRAGNPALVSVFAITVLPAGCVGLVKIVAYVFGPALHDVAAYSHLLLIVAGAGMCAAALVALLRQNLGERLAYACAAQALAATMGILTVDPTGLYAAVLQVFALSCGGATALMAAGAIAATTEREAVTELAGLGRVMPWTFAGFAIGCASMIGLPPFAGAWAKLWLIAASAHAGLLSAALLLGAAAILTFAQLGPLAANALAADAPADPFRRPDGASFMLVAPIVFSAAATLGLLVMADPLAEFLKPLLLGGS